MDLKKSGGQHPLRLVYLFLFTLTLAGCSTAHMPLPESMATTDPMPVRGRQGFKIKESLAFGPFDAVDIDRSWVKGGDLQARGFERNNRMQQFTFQLRRDGIDRWFVSCEAFLRKDTFHTDVIDIEITNRSEVRCYLSVPGDASEMWTLMLDEKGERPLEGRLSNDANTLTVAGTRKLAGGLPAETETGYEISSGGRTVAAVEVIGNGRVWLQEDESMNRDFLAASSAIFLLLEDLRAHIPDESGGE